jgi:outer membrane lipoprotein SlyB
MSVDSIKVPVRRAAAAAAALALLSLISGCVQEPVRTVAVAPPRPMPRLFVYPAKGQSEEQLERDRYECHTWAVQQTGVDPSRGDAESYQRVVVTPPPGANTAGGAIGGAILGSIIAGPRDSGFGALFGAATGAIIGSSVDANNQSQAQQAQAQINQRAADDRARAQSYRRAIGACLEARGYTVS